MKSWGLVLLVCGLLLLPAAGVAQAAPADPLWQELAAGNARFVAGKPRARDLLAERKKLAGSQAPRVAVLACADSRVAPELLFDQSLGDLFVVRTAGNSPDPAAIGSLEYAVENLGTTMIVVMGHQSCGAVKAACSGQKMPSPNLEAVAAPIRSSCSLAKGKDVEPAARAHVHWAAATLLAQSPILRKRVAEKKLAIVEAYYSLDSGMVERLR